MRKRGIADEEEREKEGQARRESDYFNSRPSFLLKTPDTRQAPRPHHRPNQANNDQGHRLGVAFASLDWAPYRNA